MSTQGSEVLAAVLTVALAALTYGVLVPAVAAARSPRATPRGGGRLAVLLGQDGRLSTSKTVAAAWTLVVAYVLVTLLLIWPSDWDKPLGNLYPTYLLLLGGPFGALVLAKAVVSTRTTNQSLVKSQGDGYPRLSDLVNDDSGQTDLFDAQFVLFNVLAMWFVIGAFLHDVTNGLTPIPNGLALLTGGPAAVYLSNKLFAGDGGPSVSSVVPPTVTAGEEFVVRGSDFFAGHVPGVTRTDDRCLLVGTVRVAVDPAGWTDTTVRAVAPPVGADSGKPLQVTVIGPSGATAALDGAVTVRDRPVVGAFTSSPVPGGTEVTTTVVWPVDTLAGDAVTIDVGGHLLVDRTAGPGPRPLTFRLPGGLAGEAVPVTVRASGPVSEPRALTLG